LLLALIASTAVSNAIQIPQQKKPDVPAVESPTKTAFRKKIEEKLNEMFSEQFNIETDKIKPEARLVEDLKGDDLDVTEMVMRVEEGFELEIPSEDVEKLKCVKDFYDYVEKRLQEKPKPQGAWRFLVLRLDAFSQTNVL
jgi:acyl carrier protein